VFLRLPLILLYYFALLCVFAPLREDLLTVEQKKKAIPSGRHFRSSGARSADVGAVVSGCVLKFQRKLAYAGRKTLVHLAAPDLKKLPASGYRVRGCCAGRGPSGASDVVSPSPNIGDLAGVILADSERMYNT
jgi:hypothetical protein